MTSNSAKVAIVYPGDREARRHATPDNNRLSLIFNALAERGVQAEPAMYHDDFRDEVHRQLLAVDAVLVWMNPVQDGRDRSFLDAMLRDVSAAGIFVSTHPDVILKLGTKEVLYRTRDLGWGCDTRLYRSVEQMGRELPVRLAAGEVRVLKQYRGSSGDGVWKVESAGEPTPTMLKVRHARRGGLEEQITLEAFLARCEPYFSGDGRMIDQAFQRRLPEGMVRCYLVQGQVAGLGIQAINALCPAPPGASPDEAPQPGPRLYHPPTLPGYRSLIRTLEQTWVPALQKRLDIDDDSLPVLWDCDFLLGEKNAAGEDTYVLCEINASSIAPFPESAAPFVAEAVFARLKAAGRGAS